MISNSIKDAIFLETGKSEIYELDDYFKLRLIVDFVSGMTDSYALRIFQKLKVLELAKNKSNINLHNIEDLKDSFSEFLYNHIFTSNEEIKFINKLLEKDDLLIFGGVIKDFLLAIRESKEFYDIDFKDIDLVATNIQDEIKEF